jgi:hypothetical protein
VRVRSRVGLTRLSISNQLLMTPLLRICRVSWLTFRANPSVALCLSRLGAVVRLGTTRSASERRPMSTHPK